MWIAALGAMAAIYVLFEPDHDPLRVELGDAPLFHAGRDVAPPATRLTLPVGDDEASPALARGGRRHTGRSPFRGPAHPERRWVYAAGERITGQAVVGPGGTIYVGDHARHLHAIGSGGERLWRVHLFGPVWSAAALADGVVYVGSDADAFFALGADDGKTRWRLQADGDVDGAVSFAPDGSLRFTGGRDLYSVTPAGEVRWRFRARSPFLLSAPAVDEDGTAYVGATDRYLYAVAADGRARWEHPTGGAISSSPVIGDDGTIYVGSDDQHVHAVSRDGELRWRQTLGGHVRAPVALGRNGDVIAGVYGPDARVVSLDAESGALRWSFPVGVDASEQVGVASGPLVDVDGNIYFGAYDEYVYSISAAGALRWVHRVGADVDAAPILTPEGLLLIGADDGQLYAIGEASGDAADERDGGPEAAVPGALL